MWLNFVMLGFDKHTKNDFCSLFSVLKHNSLTFWLKDISHDIQFIYICKMVIFSSVGISVIFILSVLIHIFVKVLVISFLSIYYSFIYSKCQYLCNLWPWSTKPVISSTGIFVAIGKNILYGSKWSFFLLCQKSLSKDHVPWRYLVNFLQ